MVGTVKSEVPGEREWKKLEIGPFVQREGLLGFLKERRGGLYRHVNKAALEGPLGQEIDLLLKGLEARGGIQGEGD